MRVAQKRPLESEGFLGTFDLLGLSVLFGYNYQDRVVDHTAVIEEERVIEHAHFQRHLRQETLDISLLTNNKQLNTRISLNKLIFSVAYARN